MEKQDVLMFTLLGLVILIYIIACTFAENKKNDCNNLGGVYAGDQCFKADLIKLD